MTVFLQRIEDSLEHLVANGKLVEQALTGMQGSYVELLTILAVGLLACLPVLLPRRGRQWMRHLNQAVAFFIFVLVVYTCMGVFGMLRNLIRGVNEIGHENILALYFCSMPVTIFVTSMIFGPSFCGWTCPTGALQELVAAIFGRRRGAAAQTGRWRPWLMAGTTAAVFLLGVAYLTQTRILFHEDSGIYWSEVLIAILFLVAWRRSVWDRPLRKLRLVSLLVILLAAIAGWQITSPVHFTFAKVWDPASALATLVVILASLSVPHAWCRYLCPWREVIRWAAGHSVRRIESVPSACQHCGKCSSVCRLDAIRDGAVDRAECHLCLRCVDNCPASAIRVVDRWRAEP